MAEQPLRFVHAADLRLGEPPSGLAEIPDHVRGDLLDAAYHAAERVFDVTLEESAGFLVLSGGVFGRSGCSARTFAFLAEQFGRLAERGVTVYWADGPFVAGGASPYEFEWPDNVCIFPPGSTGEFSFQRQGFCLARLLGQSGDRVSLNRVDLPRDARGCFTIVVLHERDEADEASLLAIDYVASGGQADRRTSSMGSTVLHWPGTPQGRRAQEEGAHGCTIVEADVDGRPHLRFQATDSLRWHTAQQVVRESTTRAQLEARLHEHVQELKATADGRQLLVNWHVTGSEHLVPRVNRATLAAELLAWFRRQFGLARPTLWSNSVVVECGDATERFQHEGDTILGEFLRELGALVADPAKELDLGVAPRATEAGALARTGARLRIADAHWRERVLKLAAALGTELLGGEEASA